MPNKANAQRLATFEAGQAEIVTYNRWDIAAGIIEDLDHKAQEIQDTISAKDSEPTLTEEAIGWLDYASETLDKAARNLEELRDLLWSDYEDARSNALALLG
jgi:hypothetical protein